LIEDLVSFVAGACFMSKNEKPAALDFSGWGGVKLDCSFLRSLDTFKVNVEL